MAGTSSFGRLVIYILLKRGTGRVVRTSRASAVPTSALPADPRPRPRALLGVEYRLAQPDRGRGHLGALIVRAELERLLQAQRSRRNQPLKFLSRRLAHVAELLLPRDVDIHVVRARVLAHDHA